MGRPRLAAVMLAAGSSRRFGAADKLAALYRGKPLALHAAHAMPVDRIERAWVITSTADHQLAPDWRASGFATVVNARADQGMGTSVALAARLAQRADMDGLLIALADMPLVPRSHFSALIDAFAGPATIAVSAMGEARMPPAILGANHFAALAEASGDVGARELLNKGEVVDCPPEYLADIDTPGDL